MTSNSNGNKEQLPENASTEKDTSVYDLLKGRLKFTNESQWARIVVYLITALFFIGVCWILKGSAIIAFLTKKLNDKWHAVSKFFKGNAQ
jgi:hypothetical protein